VAADSPNVEPTPTPTPDAAAKAEPRTPEQIRLEIAEQRENLTRSVSDLRQGMHDARKIPLIVGGALVAGVATFFAVKALRGDDD
jgi:hypothetical protein